MADQVELLFKFDTQGAPQLDEVSKIVEQLGQKSALTGGQINIVEQALKTMVASGESARSALEAVAASSATLGREAANAAKSLLEESAAVRSVGTAAGSTVSPVLAASAALRGLDGSLNIRAAERFLTQFSGINTVLQGTFQIFGAIAVADFAVRGAEGLYKLYEAYSPVIQAEKEYQKVAQESGKVIEQLRAEELKLYLDRIAHSQGKAAELQVAVNTPTDQVKIDAANFVDAINKVTEAQKALKEAQDPNLLIDAAVGGFAPPNSIDAAETKLKTAQIQLEEAEERVNVDSAQKAALGTELAETVLQKRLETAKALYEYEKQTADLHEHTLALQDRATYGSGPLGSIVNAQRAADRALQPKLDAVEYDRQQNALGGPNATRKPDSEFDQRSSAITADQAADALARAHEFMDKLHDLSQKAVEDFKKVQDEAEKTAEALSKKSASDFSKDLEAKIKKEGTDITELRKAIDISYQSDNDVLQQQFRKSSTLAGLSTPVGSTQGSVGAATAALQERLRLIEEIGVNEEHMAAVAGDAGQQQVALEQARKKLVQDTGEAEIDYALKVAEIQRQRLEDARNAAGRVFDALVGGQKSIEDLAKSFALSQGKAVFQNLTQGLFSSTSTSLHGLVGQGSPLASLLTGTVLEPGSGNTPVDRNTVALNTLTAMLARVSGFGGAGITGPLAGLPFGPGGGTSLLAAALRLSSGNSYTDLPLNVGDDTAVTAASIPGLYPNYAQEAADAGLTSSGGGSGFGTDIGIAGAAVGAGFGIYSGIQQGGVRGASTAIGSVGAATAAIGAILGDAGSMVPIIGSVLAIAAPLITALLPDPKAAFDAAQTQTLNNDKYTMPQVINGTFDEATGSNQVNTDYRGGTRVTLQNNTVVHINALDYDSLANRQADLAKVIGDATRAGNPDMQIAINRVVFGPSAG